MTILWIKCESVLLIVALQMEEIDYKWLMNDKLEKMWNLLWPTSSTILAFD
jgi:DNA polymerase sigma